MELKDLDNLHEAAQIAEGVRKNMMMIESTQDKGMSNEIFIVFITALEKAVYLMNEVSGAMEKIIVT